MVEYKWATTFSKSAPRTGSRRASLSYWGYGIGREGLYLVLVDGAFHVIEDLLPRVPLRDRLVNGVLQVAELRRAVHNHHLRSRMEPFHHQHNAHLGE